MISLCFITPTHKAFTSGLPAYVSSKVTSPPIFGEKAPKSDALLVGIGENAGVVDVGQGYAVTFKIESHNHPSFVEPYQGAATGVGGIVRDILTMGARPIAVMDPLRFGPADAPIPTNKASDFGAFSPNCFK